MAHTTATSSSSNVPNPAGTDGSADARPQPNILVVDDDLSRRQKIAQLLGEGYGVSYADSADAAVVAAPAANLVVLHMQSVRANPYQVLRRLKATPATVSKPVMVVSPAESVESVVRCLEMGAADYVLEPLHPPLTRARVEQILGDEAMRLRLTELQELDAQAASALKATEKYERDVLIGRQIQNGFLPKAMPKVENWEFSGRFQPAREVAGDWYDAFTLDHIRRVGLVIADVCDKGVGAALFMALMRSLIRAFAQMPSSLRWLDALDDSVPAAAPFAPAAGGRAGRRREAPTAGSTALRSAIEQTNNYIAHNHSDTGMFATLFFGILDPATGQLQYINGGHEPPILIGPDGKIKERLNPTGMAVGMLEGSAFEAKSTRLEPGDVLLTYTDGVTEARDPDRKFYTEARLLDFVSRPPTSAAGLLDRLLDSVRAHIADADQFDDITMLAVRRLPDS